MKLDLKKIPDQLIALLHRKGAEYRTISAKAHHDWKVMVILFAVLGVVIVFANIMLFRMIANSEYLSTQVSVPLSREQVSEKTLQSTIDYYEAKAQKLSEIEANPPKSFDPSL